MLYKKHITHNLNICYKLGFLWVLSFNPKPYLHKLLVQMASFNPRPLLLFDLITLVTASKP
jgi:hypothetical protein